MRLQSRRGIRFGNRQAHHNAYAGSHKQKRRRRGPQESPAATPFICLQILLLFYYYSSGSLPPHRDPVRILLPPRSSSGSAIWTPRLACSGISGIFCKYTGTFLSFPVIYSGIQRIFRKYTGTFLIFPSIYSGILLFFREYTGIFLFSPVRLFRYFDSFFRIYRNIGCRQAIRSFGSGTSASSSAPPHEIPASRLRSRSGPPRSPPQACAPSA